MYTHTSLKEDVPTHFRPLTKLKKIRHDKVFTTLKENDAGA